MTKIGISFDDSLVDQLHWARMLKAFDIQGVFYISPGRLTMEPRVLRRRIDSYLTEEHVARIADMGHVIGNHTWDHEAPVNGMCEVLPRPALPVEEVLASVEKAREWLDARGYEGSLLSLPHGAQGGLWEKDLQERLAQDGYVLRDIRYGEQLEAPSGIVAALYSTAPPIGQLDLRYFHGNWQTLDVDMARFVVSVSEAIKAGEAQLVLPSRGEDTWVQLSQ